MHNNEELEITATETPEEEASEINTLPEYHCKRCGKIFFPTPLHRYKDSRGKYCCWTCFKHRNDGKRNHYDTVECHWSTGELVRSFRNSEHAAKWIGADAKLIENACIDGTLYFGYLWRYKR